MRIVFPCTNLELSLHTLFERCILIRRGFLTARRESLAPVVLVRWIYDISAFLIAAPLAPHGRQRS